MSADAQKIAYAYSYLRRKYVGPRLTSGSLTVGSVYLLQTFNTGDDFTNVGAASNADRVLFTATGTTPTVWTKSSILRLVDLAALRALEITVFEDTTDPGVTLTSGSFEGGQGSGIVTFEKINLGLAIAKLLSEIDPDYDAPAAGRSNGFVMQLGGCC